MSSTQLRTSIEVLHAPNPTDIRWEFLEVHWWEKRSRSWIGRLILIPCLFLSCAGMVTAAYWHGALKAGPIFLDCVDTEPLAPKCDWSLWPKLLANVGNFLWCTALLISSVHIVLQPILILSERRDANQSHTSLQLSLFLRFIMWQLALTISGTLIVCVGISIFFWKDGRTDT